MINIVVYGLETKKTISPFLIHSLLLFFSPSSQPFFFFFFFDNMIVSFFYMTYTNLFGSIYSIWLYLLNQPLNFIQKVSSVSFSAHNAGTRTWHSKLDLDLDSGSRRKITITFKKKMKLVNVDLYKNFQEYWHNLSFKVEKKSYFV